MGFKENLKACYLTAIYIRMNSGALLRAGAGLRGRIQVRGRAVQNWKRPTMDEYGVPTESWAVVNARNQKKYNGMLAAGLAFFGLTSVYCWFSDKTVFYTVPRHLIPLKISSIWLHNNNMKILLCKEVKLKFATKFFISHLFLCSRGMYDDQYAKRKIQATSRLQCAYYFVMSMFVIYIILRKYLLIAFYEIR